LPGYQAVDRISSATPEVTLLIICYGKLMILGEITGRWNKAGKMVVLVPTTDRNGSYSTTVAWQKTQGCLYPGCGNP